ncbi:hypothetical protein Syun_027795 [Stephania yunnanensis]|uniref:Uncharacterized protein n=1 Tax=Stephania yunnanensis TaxID=152371 RepID=A0AAP0EGK3_9MAGN
MLCGVLLLPNVGADLFWALFSSLFGSDRSKEPREYALSLGCCPRDGESKCFKAAL